MTAARRLPIGPLLRLALNSYGVDALNVDGDGRRVGAQLDDRALAVILNVNPDSLGRWRRRGWIGEPQADAVAAELGLHGSTIWPDEWLADIDVDALELDLEDA